MTTSSGPLLTVHTATVAANTRAISRRTDAAVMAVVKAGAYGHALPASTFLDHGASWLGVTSIAEALPYRWQGVTAPVLAWLNPVDADFGVAILSDVDVAVPSTAHLDAVARAAVRTGLTARVHLHVDVGLARDGAPRRDWPALCAAARDLERRGQVRVVGLMGHLSAGEDPADPEMHTETVRFTGAVAVARRRGLRPQVTHLAATSGTLADRRTHMGMVRVGAGLYGLGGAAHGLRGAMTFTAPVGLVRDVRAGTPVGYGHRYRTPVRTRLALVPVGYADGLPRHASGRAEVLVRGRRRPVVGTISMDQVVVDVGDVSVAPGETVTVFGPGDRGEPTVAEWAAWADTVEQDVLAGLGTRVARFHEPMPTCPAPRERTARVRCDRTPTGSTEQVSA
ncbi:alanine racemase [Cellulomonas bogoriensis]|nr:alanine racemase [Cellulomonas bogoriensis]